MRQWLFSILFIGAVSSGLTALAQHDPFLEAERVPFPFTDESAKEVMEQSTFAKDVPVPPDTLASPQAENAEGYVPEVYGRSAPEPAPVVLRPRYRSGSSAAAKTQTGKSSKQVNTSTVQQSKNSSNTQNPQNSQELQHPIRQVSASDAPTPPAEFADPIPTTPNVPAPLSASQLKFPISLSPQKKTAQTSNRTLERQQPLLQPKSNNTELAELQQDQLQSPFTVNNTHTCDELTCGVGGCSGGRSDGCSDGYSESVAEKFTFKHLSVDKPRHGLCGCCGFLRCVNKTVGPWYYDGWLSAGSFMNTHWPEGRKNELGGNSLYYNDRNGEAVMNQFYLTLGRRINPRGGRWDLGGRIDLLYGTDYFYTSTLGLETRQALYYSPEIDGSIPATLDPLKASLHWNSNSGLRRNSGLGGTASLYGLSLPQAYAEMFVPFGYGITVKAGHFYSGMGIESAMSPNNFFYSHSYSFMYGEPTTLTGATATVKLGSGASAMLGISRGWNVWDKQTDTVSGLVGLGWESFDKQTSLSFLLHSGEESLRQSDNRTNYTLTLRHRLASNWVYALEHSFGNEKNGAILNANVDPIQRGDAKWYSIAQYLQWEWNERFALGFRGEWFRDDGHSRVQQQAIVSPGGALSLSGKDYFEITFGANWKPTRFLTIRPEIRYDWSDVTTHLGKESQGIYNGKREMTSVAIDGIFRF